MGFSPPGPGGRPGRPDRRPHDRPDGPFLRFAGGGAGRPPQEGEVVLTQGAVGREGTDGTVGDRVTLTLVPLMKGLTGRAPYIPPLVHGSFAVAVVILGLTAVTVPVRAALRGTLDA
ncbi:hypothetical protein ABZ825_39935 [Streptomyces tauricus]|uniref:hypothetical protein n=1 Tax=Streptomyces tauricus TaxID=68274 RepID=UPI00340003AF